MKYFILIQHVYFSMIKLLQVKKQIARSKRAYYSKAGFNLILIFIACYFLGLFLFVKQWPWLYENYIKYAAPIMYFIGLINLVVFIYYSIKIYYYNLKIKQLNTQLWKQSKNLPEFI